MALTFGQRERGGLAEIYGAFFGHPAAGRFLEISFRIASFQFPSIFRTSGLGPRGFFALVFDFFTAIRMASPVSESAEASPLARG
ncbi:MAG: hypothetical protein WCE23_13795, partial [Candidatus Binatus sp.]|uniref:hypothetical protein n=1 Tax=Candidatus Binatus sp. TaxID=2811406 RepID=UPI003C710474